MQCIVSLSEISARCYHHQSKLQDHSHPQCVLTVYRFEILQTIMEQEGAAAAEL